MRQNLDGVLTVGKKSVLNQYLNDMLAKNMHRVSFKGRDDHHHPFITDVVTVGHVGRPTFHREWLSTTEEWIRGCQELSKSSVVRQFLALASIHEHDGLIRLRQGRLRASSSCASESEAMTGRTRSLSYPSEEEHRPQTLREGTLDRIINKTANMDLSTSDLAQEKSIWLAKEIRAVRKKLNQITKLRDAEAKSIVLTSDEQAKLDRHPVLEAELHIYQTALDEVEKRIHELISVDQHKCQVATTDDTIESEDNVASCKSSKNVDEGKPVSKSFEQESLESSYSCEICGIKCPDNTSFELHQNGRKHRNRMLQVEEKEKQRAAQSIIAQKQLEQVKSPTETISIASTKKNAWGVSSTPPPKFKLPPPPHPVVAQVVTPTTIAVKNTLFAPSLKVSPVPNFQNILGQKEAIKERAPNPTPLQQKTVSPVWTKSTQSPVSNRSPFHLHPAPNLTLQPPSSGQRSSYSLGDFLAPKPTVKPTPKVTPTVVAWTSPAKAIRNEALTVKPKSLAEIQAEEVDFKAREDRAYVCSDGKESSWFIERRERADSLHAIQQAAEVERETQLMIQEQLEIEAQIKKEIAAQRKKEKEQQDKKAGSIVKRPKKRNNPNKKNSKDTESPSNQRSQESAPAASKSQKPQSSKPGGGRSSRGPKKAIISHSESC